jgi:4-amino-4-deoxy-L-arabinose transferase-like glycosyltransferase
MSSALAPTIEQSGMREIASRMALPCVMLLAAALRLWHLGDAGFGTEYYAAAVRGMEMSVHNLLYNAFDPAGILMVDKPPLALWAQVLSARLLGYSAFSLMLPQAIEGSLSVLLVWHLMCRDFGETAAILAALFLAVTPIAVAVDRSNNTDSLLVLVLLLAVWALPRGGDKGAVWRLMLAMALVGVGFNVKMAVAFGVLPGFVAAYFLTARESWVRRLVHLAAGGVVLVAVSASWVGIVALTPPEDRPYVDSSPSNSIFDLAVNHNAVQRLVPGGWGEAAAGAARRRVPPPGVGRLASPVLASQVIWLLPLGFAGAVAMVAARRREAACVWIGWALAYGVVFSFAGGLFSPYYLVMLGPPLAVLGGVGVVALGALWREPGWRRWWLPAVLALSLGWQAYVLSPEVWDSVRGLILIAALAGILLALAALVPVIRGGRGAVPALAIGVVALLIAPSVWAVGAIVHEGGRPLARLERVGRAGDGESSQLNELVPFLRENQAAARFLAATANARMAAPLIIATGEPVIAFGGFQGTMPVVDGASLGRLAESGALRFVILGNGRGRGSARDTATTRWVRAHGTRVDLATVAPEVGDAGFALYDLGQGVSARISPGARGDVR